MAYDAKAQEFVYGFYARGWSRDRSLPEIRKVYAGFAGSTWDKWLKDLDWPARRAASDVALREFEDLCRDTTRVLVIELKTIKDALFDKVKDGKGDTQTVYAYTSVTKQIAELTREHMADRDVDRVAIGVLNTAVEQLLTGLRGINGLAKPLEAHAAEIGDIVAAIAQQHGREGRA